MPQPQTPPPRKNPVLIGIALCIALPAMFLAKGKLHGPGGIGISSGALGMLVGIAVVAVYMWAIWYLKKP